MDLGSSGVRRREIDVRLFFGGGVILIGRDDVNKQVRWPGKFQRGLGDKPNMWKAKWLVGGSELRLLCPLFLFFLLRGRDDPTPGRNP